MDPIHTLVLACGNPLRGDDGVGPAAADAIRSWQVPGVKVVTVHQFTPELIDELIPVARVLFIDAAISTAEGPFDSCLLEPKRSRRFFGHFETPANLLALLYELEGRTPEAWLVTISAYTFDHGDTLSEHAAARLPLALAWIRTWLLSTRV